MGQIGVIGLGNIGGAIATNLATDGHTVTVTDTDPGRAAAVTGARAVGDAAEVAAASDITFASLPTPEVIAEVAGRWASAAPAGSIFCDLSTSAPAATQALAQSLNATGHHPVDAALSGGAVGAHKRALVFMVGGDDEAVNRVRPLLDTLGRATFHLGPTGAGTTMKLANSLVAFTAAWSSLEALSIAVAGGLDLTSAVEVIRTGGASNFFIDRAVDGIDTRGREPGFSIELAAKDAHLIEDLAASCEVPAPIATAIAGLFADAVDRGLSGHDWSDLVVAAEARAGVELTFEPSR